jgi:hypothetical protein
MAEPRVAEPRAAEPPHWCTEHDQILVDWADKAMCYRWLHNRENEHFSVRNMWFTIPVIVISTVTGTANFAQEHFPDHRSTMSMVIGAFNIAAAIITTVAQFLKVAEVNESHRVATLSWDKFYRNVRLIVTKCPLERLPVDAQLKSIKEEFDRMMELSPPISRQVVQQFQQTFQARPEYATIIKPDICGELQSTAAFLYTATAATAATPTEDSEFRARFRSVHNRSPQSFELE